MDLLILIIHSLTIMQYLQVRYLTVLRAFYTRSSLSRPISWEPILEAKLNLFTLYSTVYQILKLLYSRREAKFDRASFYGTQFKEDVDFDSAKFNEFGDFSLAKFEKKIYFNHVNFARILINWENIKDKFISDGPTYFAMIKNFKDIEQYVDADSCYYQYRDIKRKSEPMGNSKILDYMAWLSCGYGVRWLNTIITAIMILMLFGVYYESYYVIGLIRNYIFSKNIKVVDYYDIKIKLLNSFYFSIVMLLSLPSEWFPSGKDEFSKLLRRHMFSAVLERLIGWGLMLLLIGTLSRLMIRY